jgi:peptidoglycan/xylan/chitin deacetylase (PgdA/CDA1 family)
MEIIIKKLFDLGVNLLGISFVLNKFYKNQAIILCFHRINDLDTIRKSANSSLFFEKNQFEKLLISLKENYEILSLEKLVEIFKHGIKIRKKIVVLTFDDGYEDNYINAYPLLLKHKVPATIFLVTDYIEPDPMKCFWWDLIENFFCNKNKYKSTECDIDIVLKKNFYEIIYCNKQKDRLELINKILRNFASKKYCYDREIFINWIKENKKHCKLRPMTLNWSQISEMGKSKLIDFGSHTNTHIYLDEINNHEIIKDIYNSKIIIEEKTNKKCKYFSYPGGKYIKNIEKILSDLNFEAAVTTKMGGCKRNDNLMFLNRVDAAYTAIDKKFSFYRLASLCSGVYNNIYKS